MDIDIYDRPEAKKFVKTLAGILVSGAEQIAKAPGLE
jgi:hypothetical protein